MKRVILLTFIFLLFSLLTGVNAAVFNVTNVTEFQSALDAAENNGEDDTINVAAGTYNVTTTPAYNGTEPKSLIIEGAGTGVTIIDGGGNIQILSITSTFYHPTGHSIIRGISFRNGYATSDNGGGLAFDAQTNVTVEDSEFTDNHADFNGGGAAIDAAYGSITFTNNILNSNSESDYGSGVSASAFSGPIIISNNTFTGNNGADFGGGV